MTSRYRLAMAAPEPYGGFRSGWTPVGGVRLHARTRDGDGIRVVLVPGPAVLAPLPDADRRAAGPTVYSAAAHLGVPVEAFLDRVL